MVSHRSTSENPSKLCKNLFARSSRLLWASRCSRKPPAFPPPTNAFLAPPAAVPTAFVAPSAAVVPPPVEGLVTTAPQAKSYVYPRLNQTAEQQAADEYECHKWAVSQTGFDPTTAATGQKAGAAPALRDSYQRASSACLEGRGYTVR